MYTNLRHWVQYYIKNPHHGVLLYSTCTVTWKNGCHIKKKVHKSDTFEESVQKPLWLIAVILSRICTHFRLVLLYMFKPYAQCTDHIAHCVCTTSTCVTIVYSHLLHLYRKWLLKVLCFNMIVKNIVYCEPFNVQPNAQSSSMGSIYHVLHHTLTVNIIQDFNPFICTDDTHRLMWNGQYVWVDDTNYFTSNACLRQRFDVNKHPELSPLSTFTSHESTFYNIMSNSNMPLSTGSLTAKIILFNVRNLSPRSCCHS